MCVICTVFNMMFSMTVRCPKQWCFGAHSKHVRYVIQPVTDTKRFAQATRCQTVVYRYVDKEAVNATLWTILLYNRAQYTRLGHLTMPHSRSYRWRRQRWPWSDALLVALSMTSTVKDILNRS